MYTEEEAKKMWCPEERKSTGIESSGKLVFIASNEWAHCRASECMMWRWEHKNKNVRRLIKNPLGYCGKGGKP